MTKIEELQAQVASLTAALAVKNTVTPHSLGFKVSDKGAVSVYGLGRFPVTLYAGQWERLINNSDKIKGFIVANIETLAKKAA